MTHIRSDLSLCKGAPAGGRAVFAVLACLALAACPGQSELVSSAPDADPVTPIDTTMSSTTTYPQSSEY